MTVTTRDAYQVAAYFAYVSGKPGPSWQPQVREFPECFVIWAVPPKPVLGTGVRTVIDRETARLTVYPAAAPEEIRRLHQQSPLPAPSTTDSLVALRRMGSRVATPNTAAMLTFADGILRKALGAKGDQVVQHHPLVLDWLTDHEPGDLVRGTYRHAELVVVSDWLHDLEHTATLNGLPPVDLDQARAVARGLSSVEVRYVREEGDPLGGAPGEPCDSCLEAWVHFGIAPATALRQPDPGLPALTISPELERFPGDVAYALAGGGYGQPVMIGERAVSRAEWAALSIDALTGSFDHAPLEALRAAIEQYPYVKVMRSGPGVTHRIRPFELAPDLAEHTAVTLADFAAVIGEPLAPLGTEQDAIIAIDARGLVFVLDQAGEWFAGRDIDTALINLVQGNRLARVRDDGSIEVPGPSDLDEA
jgi:hypothetical protein